MISDIQPAPYADTPDSDAEQRKLYGIATAQRWMIWAILSQFLALLPVPYIALFTGFLSAFAVYRLAEAMQNRLAWLYGIASFVPLLNLFVLLRINASATKYLQEAGITVGLMGASSTAIRHLNATK